MLLLLSDSLKIMGDSSIVLFLRLLNESRLFLFFFFSFPFHFRNHPDFLHLHKHSSVFSALQPADEVQREVRFDLRKFPLLHGVMNFGRLGFRFYKKSSPRCTHQVAKMLKGMITRKIKRKKPKVIWKAIKESEQV